MKEGDYDNDGNDDDACGVAMEAVKQLETASQTEEVARRLKEEQEEEGNNGIAAAAATTTTLDSLMELFHERLTDVRVYHARHSVGVNNKSNNTAAAAAAAPFW